MKKKVIRITEKKLVEQISKSIGGFDSEKLFLDALNKLLKTSRLDSKYEDFVGYEDLKNLSPEDISKLNKVYKKTKDVETKDVETKDVEIKKPSSRGSVDFNFITDLIIDNLEGGYYHPRMNKGNMGSSGETMFGLDRKHGQQEKTALGREFWGLIDKQNAKYNWPWNYKGGNISGKLRELAAGIMDPLFNSYSRKYLSDESYNIMMSDPRIYLNFAYATWNGIGWFKRFAEAFNKEVGKGITDLNRLTQFLLNQRRNSGNKWISGSTDKVKTAMERT
jgi:hypothetical protein